jgi:hypothetical protein
MYQCTVFGVQYILKFVLNNPVEEFPWLILIMKHLTLPGGAIPSIHKIGSTIADLKCISLLCFFVQYILKFVLNNPVEEFPWLILIMKHLTLPGGAIPSIHKIGSTIATG